MITASSALLLPAATSTGPATAMLAWHQSILAASPHIASAHYSREPILAFQAQLLASDSLPLSISPVIFLLFALLAAVLIGAALIGLSRWRLPAKPTPLDAEPGRHLYRALR